MEPQTPRPDAMTEAALHSLRDIALPPPVSWTPQTWGWVLLGLILLAGLVAAFLLWIRRYRANAYRREALVILAGIKNDIRDPLSRHKALGQLAALVKRTALAAWPRPEVADLSGAAWARFLHEHGNDEAGHALERLVDDFEYHGSDGGGLPSNVCDDLIKATRKWIERHHVPA